MKRIIKCLGLATNGKRVIWRAIDITQKSSGPLRSIMHMEMTWNYLFYLIKVPFWPSLLVPHTVHLAILTFSGHPSLARWASAGKRFPVQKRVVFGIGLPPRQVLGAKFWEPYGV